MLFPMFANNPNKSPSPGFGEKVCYGLGDFASCIMGAVTNYILMSHMRRFDHRYHKSDSRIPHRLFRFPLSQLKEALIPRRTLQHNPNLSAESTDFVS